MTDTTQDSLRHRFGKTPRGSVQLPERIQKIVSEQELESERLIGWAQLTFAFVFMSLFLLAPRPVDAPMIPYEPVPIALGAYALFTVIRLAASYRDFTPPWLLILSTLLDVILIIGLVWYFHLQYEQPPAFSLKVPTFVYLFAFIALRALRFDPRYVLLSGIFAAVGWLCLVTYAIYASPDGTITRSFTEYVNGNRILRGAEFGKVFSILTVTAVLSLAIWRARQTLLRAATEISTSREMRKFLSEGVAETIADHGTSLIAGEATERDAAIVMIDIRGFSNFSSKVSPREIVDMLTSYHDHMVPIIQTHGGVVDKFMGDGLMATFGAVTESQTAARNATEALEDILTASTEWQKMHEDNSMASKLTINAAAASGRVVFATLGSADRLEYTVIGDAANLAAKLEKHNKSERTSVLVTRHTWLAARNQGFEPRVRHEKRRNRNVEGIGEPVDLVAMLAVD